MHLASIRTNNANYIIIEYLSVSIFRVCQVNILTARLACVRLPWMVYVPNQAYFLKCKNDCKSYVEVVPMRSPVMSATWSIVVSTCSHDKMSSHDRMSGDRYSCRRQFAQSQLGLAAGAQLEL